MATKRSYYAILGVPRSESAGGIRAAYRDLARRYHPDHADTADPKEFRRVRQAYEVLSDPERRKAYNGSLDGEMARNAPIAEPRSRSRSAPEPLVRERRSAEPLTPEPMSLFRDFQTLRPSFGALWDRFQRNFTGVGVPKAERLEALNVEVVLTPEQAVYGVDVPLGVPVFSTCPACGGSGRQWSFPCLDCGQEGYVEGEAVVSIDVPAGVRSGTVFEIPMTGLGIDNLFLRLHVVVAD